MQAEPGLLVQYQVQFSKGFNQYGTITQFKLKGSVNVYFSRFIYPILLSAGVLAHFYENNETVC